MTNVKSDRKRLPKKEEIDRLIDSISEDWKAKRNKSMVALLYITGCRLSELLDIEKGDIFFDKRHMYIKMPSLKRKDGTTINPRRIIRINQNTPYIKYIINYLRTITQSKKLFNISRIQAWRIINKHTKELWPYLFRHNRATRLADKGAGVFRLQDWFGWKKAERASSYVQASGRRSWPLGDKID